MFRSAANIFIFRKIVMEQMGTGLNGRMSLFNSKGFAVTGRNAVFDTARHG